MVTEGAPYKWTYLLTDSLSEQIRQLDISFGQFEQSLKTFMFG